MGGRHNGAILAACGNLTVACYRAELAGQEMIRRPWPADGHLTVLQLFGGGIVTVLVFLDRLGIDQVRDIDQHAFGINLLTADLLLKRIKELVDLNRKGSRLGLTLAVARSFDPKLCQVLASNSIRQLGVDHGIAKRTVANHKLDVHLRLAAEPLYALFEGSSIGANGLAQRIVGIKNSSKTERQHGALPETQTNHTSMLEHGFLIQLPGAALVFADDDREVPARIAEDGGTVHSLQTIEQKRTTRTVSIGEGL